MKQGLTTAKITRTPVDDYCI